MEFSLEHEVGGYPLSDRSGLPFDEKCVLIVRKVHLLSICNKRREKALYLLDNHFCGKNPSKQFVRSSSDNSSQEAILGNLKQIRVTAAKVPRFSQHH